MALYDFILTSQVRNYPSFPNEETEAQGSETAFTTQLTCVQSLHSSSTVFGKNIPIKRASNTYTKQMINFPENHWTLKAKWLLLKFTGTSRGTHTMIFPAQAGH